MTVRPVQLGKVLIQLGPCAGFDSPALSEVRVPKGMVPNANGPTQQRNVGPRLCRLAKAGLFPQKTLMTVDTVRALAFPAVRSLKAEALSEAASQTATS